MSHFADWLRRKRIAEGLDSGDPSDRFRFNPGEGDMADDYEKNQSELIKVILSKYPSEFHAFVDRMADERGDEEIRSLNRKLRTGKRDGIGIKEPKHPSDKPEIVAPISDRGQGEGNN